MSEQQIAQTHPGSEEIQSALFAQLVMQQSNMALMLLGKVAHPESGQTYKDVEAARLFIDQLENQKRTPTEPHRRHHQKEQVQLQRWRTSIAKNSARNIRFERTYFDCDFADPVAGGMMV